jgi:FlaA1/EpsC-like NDP-sugar epimerase
MLWRNVTKILIDALAWTLVLPLAYVIRLEMEALDYAGDILTVTLLFFPIKLAIVWLNRHHLYSWRYSGLVDSLHLLRSVVIMMVLLLVARVLIGDLLLIPYSVPIIEAGMSVVLFTAVRVAAHLVLRRDQSRIKSLVRKGSERSSPNRVIIVGAGEAGIALLRSLSLVNGDRQQLVGFVDDDPEKQGQTIAGLKMLGTIEELPAIAERHQVSDLIIAIPSASGKQIRRIVDIARSAKLGYKTVPRREELGPHALSAAALRELKIEDLLGRETVQLDNTSISELIREKRVLVTGAGGSIGSEVVRQLLPYHPKEIVLLGRGENSLHQIMLELERDHPHQRFRTRVCTITDQAGLERVFEEFHPEIIFHAAAHKHVRLMEENPAEAVFNNVVGTTHLVNLALKYQVKHLVNISTDKAINPTSVMGACKRLTEIVVQKAAEQAGEGYHYVSVRFGNVLGSRGSVVPIFQEQIRRGGPVTVTHEDVVRYFMTIPEAAQLVLQAAALRLNRCVFVLKMGDPVRIVDLARDLIQLSGRVPDKDIAIVYTGLQKGEKLYEELSYDSEQTDDTSHKDVLISKTNALPADVEERLQELVAAAGRFDEKEIRRLLKVLVPGYTGYTA